MTTAVAEVQVLVAEVRVLMVGSRQVTLSVFRQLDIIDYCFCEPFGRVNDGYQPWIIGKDDRTGVLARAKFDWEFPRWTNEDSGQLQYLKSRGPNLEDFEKKDLESLESFRAELPQLQEDYRRAKQEFHDLPLIVLAGLK